MTEATASTSVAQLFALAVLVLSVAGSLRNESVKPAVYGVAYDACLALALRGVWRASKLLQIVLILAMVSLSFGLHLEFLPAGALPSALQLHTRVTRTARSMPHDTSHSRPLLLLQPDDMQE